MWQGESLPSCGKQQSVAQAPLDLQLGPLHSILAAKQVNKTKIKINFSTLRKIL